jgi:hypothetical protein
VAGPPGGASGRSRIGALAAAAVGVVAVALVGIIVASLVRDGSTAPRRPARSTRRHIVRIRRRLHCAGGSARPTAAVAALTAGIRQQQQAGQLDPDVGRELTKKLDEVSRDLAKGERGKAAEKVADLREKLAELHEDDKLTTTGLNALTPLLNRLAATLPAGKHDDD